jgi:hypothetical protein
MKALSFCVILLFCASYLEAQIPVKADTVKPAEGNVKKQLKDIKDTKKELNKDSIGNQPKASERIDTTIQNKYGDLLRDDPEYNKKYQLWKPAVEIVGLNAILNIVDRYALKLAFAKTDFRTWNYTLHAGWPWGSGWKWDSDRFGNNFLFHPLFGGQYYNAARTQGYNYFSSFAYSLGGAYMWKIFGENGMPEREDLINTSISGAFFGEIFYRLSSNILDDRTRGTERVFREIAAGLINPVRGFNRLLQGKSFSVTNKEVYEKNPLNVSFYAGMRMINDSYASILKKGTTNVMINAQFDYGNPFEVRKRKPFDFFKLRVDLNFGVGRKYVDNMTGYGILFGKNLQLGKLAILAGGFNYYDYLDTKLFELSTIGFGGGLFTKLPITKTSDLYTNIHLALVPFAGNSTQKGPDTSQVRDYNYGHGLELKLETTLNLGKFATTSLMYYYYLVRTFSGLPGDNYIAILKPRITIHIFKDLNMGYEHFIYYNDRYLRNLPSTHTIRTEEKFFVMFYLEAPQRKGKYN